MLVVPLVLVVGTIRRVASKGDNALSSIASSLQSRVEGNFLIGSSPAVIAQRFFPFCSPIQSRLPALVTVLRLRLSKTRLPFAQFRVVACPPLRIRKNCVGSIDVPQALSGIVLCVRSTSKQVRMKALHQSPVAAFDLLGLCCLRDSEGFVMRLHTCHERSGTVPHSEIPVRGQTRPHRPRLSLHLSGSLLHITQELQAMAQARANSAGGAGDRANLLQLWLSIQVFYHQTLTVGNHVHAVLHNIIHHSLDD